MPNENLQTPTEGLHADNTAAFPYEHRFADYCGLAPGLTKREYFAVQALQALITRSQQYPKLAAKQLSYEAVKFADELISALAATSDTPSDTPNESSGTPGQ